MNRRSRRRSGQLKERSRSFDFVPPSGTSLRMTEGKESAAVIECRYRKAQDEGLRTGGCNFVVRA
jgi:hypothetical protein